MAYSTGGGHLAVPGLNPTNRGRYPAEHREPGHRSRSPSPSSSRGTSPTLASISLPAAPVVSGGPHSRQHNALALQANLSAHSLHPLHHIRTNRSTSSLHSGSANSSLIDIRVKGPDSPEDDVASMEYDIADHDPDRATLENKESNDADEDRPTPITPAVMEDRKYYHRPIPDGYAYVTELPPATLDFQHCYQIPMGWVRRVAPEGDVYFYNPKERVYTLSDITDEDVYLWINKWSRVLIDEKVNHKLPEDTDIALSWEDKGYYLVSWKQKVVFWLERVDVGIITDHIRYVLSYVHLALGLRTSKHVQIFPADYEFTNDCVDELHSILTFGHADFLSSETTTFPYDAELASRILHLIDKIKPGLKGLPNANYISTLARYLDNLNSEGFLHYYGERHARLSRLDTAYPRKHSTHFSRFFKMVSPLLFFQPNWYFQELQKVYVDSTVHYYAWRRFIGELKKDWENSLTPATVLLSANVGFLAIQSVDNSTNFRSVAQIASYVSALFSLFDYVVVLLLMRRHRMALYDTAERGFEFLQSREESVGLQMLALCVSLPGALFIWSILTFLVALAYIFFHDSTILTIVVTGVVTVILSVMVLNLFVMDFFGDIVRPWVCEHLNARPWIPKLSTLNFKIPEACKGRRKKVLDELPI